MEEVETPTMYMAVKWPRFQNKELTPRPAFTLTPGTGCCYACGKKGHTGTTDGNFNPVRAECVCFGIRKLKAVTIFMQHTMLIICSKSFNRKNYGNIQSYLVFPVPRGNVKSGKKEKKYRSVLSIRFDLIAK